MNKEVKCVHHSYPAYWNKKEHKWVCMKCGEMYECSMKSNIPGCECDACCPDYPHNNVKSFKKYEI